MHMGHQRVVITMPMPLHRRGRGSSSNTLSLGWVPPGLGGQPQLWPCWCFGHARQSPHGAWPAEKYLQVDPCALHVPSFSTCPPFAGPFLSCFSFRAVVSFRPFNPHSVYLHARTSICAQQCVCTHQYGFMRQRSDAAFAEMEMCSGLKPEQPYIVV